MKNRQPCGLQFQKTGNGSGPWGREFKSLHPDWSPHGSYPWGPQFSCFRQGHRPHGLPLKWTMRSAVSQKRNSCHIVVHMVLFLSVFATTRLSILNTLTRDRAGTLFVGHKRDLELLQAEWSRAKSGAGVIEPFGQSMRDSIVCWGWQIPSIRLGACLRSLRG